MAENDTTRKLMVGLVAIAVGSVFIFDWLSALGVAAAVLYIIPVIANDAPHDPRLSSHWAMHWWSHRAAKRAKSTSSCFYNAARILRHQK